MRRATLWGAALLGTLALCAGGLAIKSWLDQSTNLARSLGRGINLGNMLEAPREGDWGLVLELHYIKLAREAGFDTLRLPVRWSNWAEPQSPYRIDERFFQRVDLVVDEAMRQGMKIVVNMHHYRQLDGDPLDPKDIRVDDGAVEERFLAMWRQIAQRYHGRDPQRVVFELYNEPHNALTADRWNVLLAKALSGIRQVAPAHYVMVGAAGFSKVEQLSALAMPVLDRRIIVTVHLYEPFKFTHQGTPWLPGSDAWVGTQCCNADQRLEITRRLDEAAQWQRWNFRPVWIGEFGSYERGDYESRVRYTQFVREEIERRGLSWAYWELASRFGIYDPKEMAWRPELRDALLARPRN